MTAGVIYEGGYLKKIQEEAVAIVSAAYAAAEG